MVPLFLSEPIWEDVEANDSSKLRKSLLSKLESVIDSFLMSQGRSEARLWLCKTISGITSVSSDDQCELFMNFLKSNPVKYDFASQLLQMIFDKRPEKAGYVISKRSYVLEKFFEGNPMRIQKWFSSFTSTEHRKGAKALSKFAFVNRDICWEELEWKGKHGQSPAVVATKPHYFLDLDVQRTVENFLENVPEFWSSNEFADSLKDGDILSVDRKFFLDYFIDLMYEQNSRDAWELVTEFLTRESFSYICDHLLIALEERDLRKFLELLREFLRIERIKLKHFGNPSSLFEAILSKCSDFESFDQILLLNVVLTKKRELLRLLCDEGGDNAKAEIRDIVTRICSIPDFEKSFSPIVKKCFKLKSMEAFKFLGIQSWVIYYKILEECKSPESCESLFTTNAITFRRSKSYALLDHNTLLEESESETDRVASKKVKHRKSSRKKRKRKFDDEFLEFDTKNDGLDLQLNRESWSLSTDKYATSWNIADLPEHLSQHSLSTWVSWVFRS